MMQTILLLGGTLLLLFFLFGHAFYKLRIPTLLGYILLGFMLSGIFKGEELNFIHDIGQISLVLLFFLVWHFNHYRNRRYDASFINNFNYMGYTRQDSRRMDWR